MTIISSILHQSVFPPILSELLVPFFSQCLQGIGKSCCVFSPGCPAELVIRAAVPASKRKPALSFLTTFQSMMVVPYPSFFAVNLTVIDISPILAGSRSALVRFVFLDSHRKSSHSSSPLFPDSSKRLYFFSFTWEPLFRQPVRPLSQVLASIEQFPPDEGSGTPFCCRVTFPDFLSLRVFSRLPFSPRTVTPSY